MAKKKKVKRIKKPKLPPNEAYWLSVAQTKSDISQFSTRGNDLQKKYLQQAIQYRLWQIQEGEIEPDFFTKLNIDLKQVKLNIKLPAKQKKKIYNGDAISPKEKEVHGKVIDLFDLANIKDLKKKV